jgi:hypothetical protein
MWKQQQGEVEVEMRRGVASMEVVLLLAGKH